MAPRAAPNKETHRSPFDEVSFVLAESLKRSPQIPVQIGTGSLGPRSRLSTLGLIRGGPNYSGGTLPPHDLVTLTGGGVGGGPIS